MFPNGVHAPPAEESGRINDKVLREMHRRYTPPPAEESGRGGGPFRHPGGKNDNTRKMDNKTGSASDRRRAG